MKSLEGTNNYIFNPEKKFLEHADKGHEESLERKKIDREYQEKFGDFFLAVFKEANIDIPDDLRGLLVKTSDVYCSPLSYLREAVTPYDPRSRILLDRKIMENFYKKWHGMLSDDELNEHITQDYAKKVDLDKLVSLVENETDRARKNFLLLIIQIINPEAIPKTENEVELKMAREAPRVGGCVMAEKNMLAYISGKHTKPEGGYVNLIVNDDGSPLILEKVGLGDMHSCISLKPVRINGVFIPAGAILSAEPDVLEPIRSKMKWFIKREGAINYVTKVKNYKGFKFVRMSLLSLPEEIRASAGGDTYLHQQDKTKGYINYDWLTPDIIAEYAVHRLKKRGILRKIRKNED